MTATLALTPTINSVNGKQIEHSVSFDQPGFNSVNFVSNGDIRFLPPTTGAMGPAATP